ncbi:MAG: pilus assembly protein PilM [Planctomycetes bacterium]|nr:pilus assembly protein PilM [Planctomycetota bacterium]
MATQGVWAIDIGTTSLKALRLQHGDEGLEVVGSSHIEHSRSLTDEGVEYDQREEIVSETLRQFMDEFEIGKDEVAISISGQNSFSRFIKLPPVEPKKIPEIVQFEAVQQIPFDINEVEWDWQLMENEDSPDKEVGLFAIKNELISEVMDHFTRENLRVTCVQIAPMALYNYAYYDRDDVAASGDKATVILDMGADSTTLVICTKNTVWQRNIRIGGNTFTQAIADAFHKDMRTAEKLKRTAPMSKYMRQIYTAMKPVYTDFGSEIQRSLGFYSSSPAGRDKTFTKVIALGGGIKLQGLAKYLTQTLGVPVIKPDSFEKLHLSPEISVAKFHENVSDFGVVYGLGAQLLGEARIATNLLPRRIARAMAWTRKARIFTIAASVLLVVMVLGLTKAFKDLKQIQGHTAIQNNNKQAVTQVRDVASLIDEQKSRLTPLTKMIKKEVGRFQYRDVVPELNTTLLKCLPSKDNAASPEEKAMHEAFEAGDVKSLLVMPRPERKLLFITRIAVDYTEDVETANFARLQNQGKGRASSSRRGGATIPGMDPALFGPGGMRPGMGQGMPPGVSEDTEDEDQETADQAGFVVMIEGYSPYRDLPKLLDPLTVSQDQNRWGLVTRFEKLQSLFPNNPFELFNKHEITHFKVETGLVDLASKEMPFGIGVQKDVERVSPDLINPTGAIGRGGNARGSDFVDTETVLLDPMTGEEISKTYDIITQRDVDTNPDWTDRDLGRKKRTPFGEDIFIERDQWFRIQAKFIWTDAPKPPA